MAERPRADSNGGTLDAKAKPGSLKRPPDNIDLSKNLPSSQDRRQHPGDRMTEDPTGSKSPSFPLTIDNLVPLEFKGHTIPSCAMTILKWIVTFFVTAGLTACVAMSKITLLELATALNATSRMNATSTINSPSVADDFRTAIFMMVTLALMIPYAMTFARALLMGAFRPHMPWPSRRAIVWCINSSLLESFGIALFALQVFQRFDTAESVLLTNTVCVIPVLYNMGAWCRGRGQENRGQESKWLVMHILALTFEIIGLAGVFVIVYTYRPVEGYNNWQMPIAILSLSIAWSPYAQQKQIEAASYENSNGYQRLGANLQTSGTSVSAVTHHGRCQTLTTRWKSSIITSFLKFIFTGAFVFGLAEPLGYFNYGGFKLGLNWASTGYLNILVANVASSVSGYLLAYLAYRLCTRRAGFILPLFLVTPVALVILTVKPVCTTFVTLLDCTTWEHHQSDTTYIALFIVSAVCLFLGQILCSESFGLSSEFTALQDESEVFWTPNYNGVMLEQWLLLCRRKTDGEGRVNCQERARNSKVFICTTMFRETETEMRDLLGSINQINLAQQEGERYFQSHVFFDGGVRHARPSRHAMRLISLLYETLHVRPEQCTRTMTPYGMTLSWKLPTEHQGQGEMLFSIHLKDSSKVKSKKRWSQVIYMSYILDFVLKREKGNDHENFMLTTDGDIMFKPESVEALLDSLTSDPSVGAVCGRTSPLGDGPMVWYQVFDYAIGHWLQKATEHVLGSVLCSPGCLSAYRCAAIRSVLPTYATSVNQAFDFLIKDMGEDRWFCTLMVQVGWKIEYCAASKSRTHCPEDFDEFYKQRRRWIASTIANLMLLIKEWKNIQAYNHGISLLFMVYQALVLFSTFIGPATVILIISGGMQYAFGDVDLSSFGLAYGVMGTQVLFSLVYMVTCLYKSQNLQLQIAKIYTLVYALVIVVVTVGAIVKVAKDISSSSGTTDTKTIDRHLANHSDISLSSVTMISSMDPLPISTVTIYLAAMVGVFAVCALLHLSEILCLLHGVWYLLCLPSGYLVLPIYSICNMTDRSWGTREEKRISAETDDVTWRVWLRQSWKLVLFCWYAADLPSKESRSAQTLSQSAVKESRDEAEEVELYSRQTHSHDEGASSRESMEVDETVGEKTLPVEDLLRGDYKDLYARKFRANGFEDSTFISGMTEKDLKAIGVSNAEHRQHLLGLIADLPEYDIEVDMPKDADVWLRQIGLHIYWENFQQNGIKTKKDLEVLKTKNIREIKTDLDITKIGHLKRLKLAIARLREPTEDEEHIMETRSAIQQARTYQLEQVNPEENHFWLDLRRKRLEPDSQAMERETQMKERLSLIRNSWLLILAITNVLWLATVLILATQAKLNLLDANPLGIVFLVVFGLLLIIQFFAMIIHRFLTLIRSLTRAPYRFGKGHRYNWAFRDDDVWPGEEQGLETGGAETSRGNRLQCHSGSGGSSARHSGSKMRRYPEAQSHSDSSSGDTNPLLQED